MVLSEKGLLEKKLISVNRKYIWWDFVILKIADYIKDEFWLKNALDVTINHCIHSDFLNEDTFRNQLEIETNDDTLLKSLLQYWSTFMRLTWYAFGRWIWFSRWKRLWNIVSSYFGKKLDIEWYTLLFDDFRMSSNTL